MFFVKQYWIGQLTISFDVICYLQVLLIYIKGVIVLDKALETNMLSEKNKKILEVLDQIESPDEKTQYKLKMHRELLRSINKLIESDHEDKLIIYRCVYIIFELISDLMDHPQTIYDFAHDRNNFYFIELVNDPMTFIIYQLSKTTKTISKLYDYPATITCD